MSVEEKAFSVETLRRLAAEIVAAYSSANSLPTSDVPRLIVTVHEALAKLADPAPAEEPGPKPAVKIGQSISDDAITCLDCGAPFAMLRRHLREAHQLSPSDYRDRWQLPGNYPLVAPAYSRRRSDVAKTMGLGQRQPVGEIAQRKRR